MKNQTMRKKTVKATSLFLAAMLSVPAISLAKDPEKVNAAYSKNMNNTHLGSATISSPAAPETKDKRWNGDYVFFGSYNGSPIKFRVLDPKTDKFGMKTMFLDSDRVLFDYPFDPSTNEWADSDLRAYLNQGFQSINFSRPEAKAIPVVSLKQESYEAGSWMEYVYGKTVPLSNDKIFLLDAADVTNPAYGYSSNPGYTYDAEQDWWKGTSVYNRAKGDLDNGYSWYWLRNKRTNSDDVVYAGAISMMDAGREATLGSMDVIIQLGVAPALNVDLDSVIFNTQTLSPDQSGLGAQYKLTVIDDNVSIGLTSGSEISVSGSYITVPYTIKGNNAGSVNQVSVLITDMPWSKGNAYNANILYYGALSGDVSTSSGTFKLPSGYDINKWGIDYHVYILAEELATGSNAVYMTDYASEPTYLIYRPDVIDIDLYKGPTMISGAAADAMLEFTLSDIADIREDDTFVYYDLDADGSEDLVFDLESGFISALENNKTIFAYTGEKISDSNISALILRFREPQNVTISFDGQGASGSIDSVSIKEASFFTIPDSTGLTPPSGYQFDGWLLNGNSVNVNEKILVTENITLVANWTKLPQSTCTITFISKLGGTQSWTETCDAGSEFTLPDCMFRAPDGYGFAQWDAGLPGDKIIVNEDMTIKAIWFSFISKPGTVYGLKAVPAGKNKVKLTWDQVQNAEGYLVYAQKDKKYGYVGMTTKGTTFTDTKALDTDYNFYWVFAYVKDENGKMIPGGCEKYVYAKGVCVAVTGLKASSVKGGVKLTWNSVSDAEGYLVYGIHPNGKYGYIGMTTKGTTYTDTKASSTDWNFYWVFPYHKNGNTMIVGGTAKYVYGKAK